MCGGSTGSHAFGADLEDIGAAALRTGGLDLGSSWVEIVSSIGPLPKKAEAQLAVAASFVGNTVARSLIVGSPGRIMT